MAQTFTATATATTSTSAAAAQMAAKLATFSVYPTTRVACEGLNGVGKACDGRACCWLPWPPSELDELDEDELEEEAPG